MMNGKTRDTFSLLLTAIAMLVLALLGGACSEDGALLPNHPPETFLAIEGGELAATHYRQILSWHGEDPDGEVVRFEYRWLYAPESGVVDSAWVGSVEPFVTATLDTFFLPLPTTGVDTLSHRFEIRAVDNEGQRDPEPATRDLPVFNQAPRILAVNAAGDTSSTLTLPGNILPVLTLRFKVLDPDNPAADPEEALAFIEEIRFWFEDPADYMSVAGTDTMISLSPEEFGELVGQERQFHLQARDMGGAMSNVLSASAFVRDVREARVLLLDSAIQQTGGNITFVEPFWHDEFPTLFQPGELMIHDVGADGPIGDPSSLDAIFSIFEAVVWYNGVDGAPLLFENDPSPEFSEAEDALRSYAELGGKVFLSGYNLLGQSRGEVSGGSLSADFEFEVLMLDSLFIHNTNTPGGVETSNWWVFPPRFFPGSASAGTDTLKLDGQALKGIDRMALNSEAVADGEIEELYHLDGDGTYPGSLDDGAVGIRRKYDDTEGQVVLLTFPITLVYGNDNVMEQIQGFMQEFGVLR